MQGWLAGDPGVGWIINPVSGIIDLVGWMIDPAGSVFYLEFGSSTPVPLVENSLITLRM